ncbi:hypothetical protein Ddye_008918 [Dipteronia dyeriana]|uniref:Uncharacterized protein n=1 Tax=Dipteronia dyeriana TaxID=168575 RepID=A0AAD9XAZ5_9ROSI|nr:hypothetical protein Ddye_008918 [Dipteronia dyeriana]
MNLNVGGPSHFSSLSFDDNNEDEVQLTVDFEAIAAEQGAIIKRHANIHLRIDQYLNQQNNQVTHGGSILGHIVINRDMESVDRNLFNYYFTENTRAVSRSPNANDVARLLCIAKHHGFPRMLGSLDCMH